MLLTTDNGAQLEAHIVGYESPINDMNLLLVAISVSTLQGSGATVENCWQIEEVHRMIAWFQAMADGVPVQRWGGGCLEAHIEFELVAKVATMVTVRASFILESGLWHPEAGGASVYHYHGSSDFDLTREDLQRIAREFTEEVEHFPPIAPLRALPSPLL
jgi:hypothetical protein